MNNSQDTQANTGMLTKLTSHEHRTISNELTTLYHVGDLSGSREKPYFSQEGKELSVSPCPNIWKHITKLTGKTYKLHNPDATFYYINPETSVTNAELCFCCKHDFITMTQGAIAEEYDIEYGTTRYWKHYNKTDAIIQAQQKELPITDAVTDAFLPKLAAQGVQYWKTTFTQPITDISPVNIESLIPIWTMLPLTKSRSIDGVFWDHPNNPRKHIAKRGLIFQSQLHNWDITQTQLD